MRTEQIKTHFEEEAKEYDIIIQKLIPHYNEMIDALVSIIPFSKDSNFTMIDLGCGTGTISKAVKTSFSNVDITCVDVAENMLEIAKDKIGGDVNCIQADFNTFQFPKKYNLIVSSLALHHLETDNDKKEFYKKIYSALTDDGIFINLDVVLGSDEKLQKVYIDKWKEFMLQNVSEEEVANKWLPNYYAEDRPTQLVTHLAMLKECGFSYIDVVYKYYNYAVYMGKK
ncbi:class I SAM-dependent methyltransferase [Anaerosporobacter sp.]|uniref:class I SAM-dependent methyltransferase n=1 Tax=Anaerosporobacter sp. TaxID=1872529 RepID=UPI00286EBDD3|nr:methyltransferase domain-containing protein [Anaerosporobacter sp.]